MQAGMCVTWPLWLFIIRSISLSIWIKLCLINVVVAANLECIQQIFVFLTIQKLERRLQYMYKLMIPLHWLGRFCTASSFTSTILIVEMNSYFDSCGCFMYQASLIHGMKLFVALNMTRIYLPRFFWRLQRDFFAFVVVAKFQCVHTTHPHR